MQASIDVLQNTPRTIKSSIMTVSLVYISIINSILCTAAVLVHYNVLTLLSVGMRRLSCKPHLRVLFGLFGAIAGHVIEIWLFAFAYYFLIQIGGFGTLLGGFANTLLDCSYFSFITYTTTGFGDIYPQGDIRYLAGLEALIGMVMISWTASFMFIEMQRLWETSPHGKK